MDKEKHECSRCSKTSSIARCKKTKTLICRDCCTRENGGFSNCIDWKFCWTSFYI